MELVTRVHEGLPRSGRDDLGALGQPAQLLFRKIGEERDPLLQEGGITLIHGGLRLIGRKYVDDLLAGDRIIRDDDSGSRLELIRELVGKVGTEL